MDTSQINEKLAELKNQRVRSATYKADMKAVLEDAKQSIKYQEAEAHAKTADQEIASLEIDIEMIALQEYEATGNKKPHPKLQIKLFKTFKIIDEMQLKVWAWTNLPAAFGLDASKVKKYADNFGPVPGTETGEEARVQIASEL